MKIKETIKIDIISYFFLLLIKSYFLTVLCFISRIPNAAFGTKPHCSSV